MNKKLLSMAASVLLFMAVCVVNGSYAGNLPETPINKILDYKTGLGLSDAQVKSLSLINSNVVNKMIQIRAQAQRVKMQIDQMASEWSDLDNPNSKKAVKEYYGCLADLKTLEFEAMAQAAQILSEQQIKKFNELASIELIMIDSEKAMPDAF